MKTKTEQTPNMERTEVLGIVRNGLDEIIEGEKYEKNVTEKR